MTKRAGDKPLTQITGTFESRSIFGAHLDVGRRFGEAGEWGVRFNGVYRKGDNTLDDSKVEFGLLALALDYRAANLRWSVDTYAQREDIEGFRVEQGKLLAGASVFQIDRPNAVTDPVTTIYSMDGNQRNRGLELSLMGEAVRNLRVMASATFYDAELQRTQGGVNDGKDANGVPKRALSAGLDWDLAAVPGLSFNARAIHTSDIPLNPTNTLYLPSWTRLDIGARYRTSLMGKPVVVRASVENLANKAYWLASGTFATTGAARTALVSAQFDF